MKNGLLKCGLLLLFAGIALVAIRHKNAVNSIDAFVGDIPRGWKDVSPKVFRETQTPAETPEASVLSPDAAGASYLALPLAPMGTQEALNNWGAVTSPRCLSLDQSEAMRTVGKSTNLLQQTNNYTHVHPDTCSAPRHEFLSTFYSPAGAIRATPPVKQCA